MHVWKIKKARNGEIYANGCRLGFTIQWIHCWRENMIFFIPVHFFMKLKIKILFISCFADYTTACLWTAWRNERRMSICYHFHFFLKKNMKIKIFHTHKEGRGKFCAKHLRGCTCWNQFLSLIKNRWFFSLIFWVSWYKTQNRNKIKYN